MSTSRNALVGAAAIALACLSLAGCSSTAGSRPGLSPGGASGSAIASPPGHPTPSADGSLVGRTAEPLPAAMLLAAGEERPGKVGGYTWKGFDDSAPWLPASALEPIAVPAGDPLGLRLDGASISSWTARAAPAADTSGTHPRGLADGGGPVGFRTPGPGTWVLEIEVRFAGGLGDAAYFWRLEVR